MMAGNWTDDGKTIMSTIQVHKLRSSKIARYTKNVTARKLRKISISRSRKIHVGILLVLLASRN